MYVFDNRRASFNLGKPRTDTDIFRLKIPEISRFGVVALAPTWSYRCSGTACALVLLQAAQLGHFRLSRENAH
jgi:hypothetical protein